MSGRRLMIGLVIALLAPTVAEAERAASLRGSPASMQEQNRVAKEHGLTFYRTAAEIRRGVEVGDLVELLGNADYAVADFVDFPYLQPEAALFVERLATQYRAACGQRLVVTSAVRPSNAQPSNAHALSVHPAGMAVDLRVSDRAECRSWLENAILGLERRGVLNGIREFRPPHYHIALYPSQYLAYASERMALEAEAYADAEAAEEQIAALADVSSGLMATDAVVLADASNEQEGRTSTVATLAALVVVLPFGVGYLLRRRRP